MKTIGTFESPEWGKVIVKTATYLNETGPLAVLLESPKGEPIATLSVNMYRPQHSDSLPFATFADSSDLPFGCFYVKNWGANERLAKEAFESGLFNFRHDLPAAKSGFVMAPVWEIAS